MTPLRFAVTSVAAAATGMALVVGSQGAANVSTEQPPSHATSFHSITIGTTAGSAFRLPSLSNGPGPALGHVSAPRRVTSGTTPAAPAAPAAAACGVAATGTMHPACATGPHLLLGG